jgi:hypothetical protein
MQITSTQHPRGQGSKAKLIRSLHQTDNVIKLVKTLPEFYFFRNEKTIIELQQTLHHARDLISILLNY